MQEKQYREALWYKIDASEIQHSIRQAQITEFLERLWVASIIIYSFPAQE